MVDFPVFALTEKNVESWLTVLRGPKYPNAAIFPLITLVVILEIAISAHWWKIGSVGSNSYLVNISIHYHHIYYYNHLIMKIIRIIS